MSIPGKTRRPRRSDSDSAGAEANAGENGNGSGECATAPLTNEFGQVQVKCSRKKPTWPSGRRNGIWVAARPRSSTPPHPLSPSLPLSREGARAPFLCQAPFSISLSFLTSRWLLAAIPH